MKLKRIVLKGFKSIRELDFELRSLNVLIGANGAGKSNFITLFHLLNQMVIGNFQNAVAKAGGAGTFLYFGEKTTKQIDVDLHFGQNAYSCSWAAAADGSLFFTKELCLYWGEHTSASGYSEHLGSGHRESRLSEAERRTGSPVQGYVSNALRSWKVYHFHDTSETASVKKSGEINDNLFLRPDAGNLAAFLFRLREGRQRDYYEAIRETVRQVAPFFEDFVLRPDPLNENMIRLEWRERGSDYPFMAYHLSDGTLRFMCLVTLLMQPTPPSTVLIDEPELGLHPYAIVVLASLLRSAAQRTQVVVSTQSVPLVNQLEPEDIVVVERAERQSTFRRLDVEGIKGWLEDYRIGDLWEKNLLGGRP